jgi:tetratricopeptide (TPR) repeat protein
MLNNSFEELVRRYKKLQRVKKIKKISFLLLALFGIFLLFKIFQKPEQKLDIVDQNITEINQTKIKEIEQNLTTKLDESNSSDDSIGKFGLKVTTQKSSKQQLLENHRKTHSYSSTMALANYFYSKKRYEDAIKWAVSASKINNLKEEPWIVYAKSKSALGEKDKAKKALEIFLKSNDSKKIRELLEIL